MQRNRWLKVCVCLHACMLTLVLFYTVVLVNSAGAENDGLDPHRSPMQKEGPLEGLHRNAPSDPPSQQSLAECLHLTSPQSTVLEEGLAEDVAPDVPLSAVSHVKNIQAGTLTSVLLKQAVTESHGW